MLEISLFSRVNGCWRTAIDACIYMRGVLEIITNEFEFDHTVITIVDDTGQRGDVRIIFEDDGVYIEQYPTFAEDAQFLKEAQKMGEALEQGLEIEIEDVPDTLFLSHKQFRDMILALQLPEGTYRTV